MKHFRALAWRLAPDLCHAISIQLPALRAYRLYGWRRRRVQSSGPVIVAGFHGAVLGLGEAARGAASALIQAGVPVQAWDVSERLGHPRRLDVGDETPPAAGPGVIVAQMNPPELIHLISVIGPAPFEKKRIIGYWAWELPVIPQSWKAAFRYVDEIWAPSTFSADAIRRAAPRRLTVKVMPLSIPENAVEPTRARFGFDPDRVIVLCAFDFRSTVARKNPLAALEAFRLARSHARTPATLVFKTVNGAEVPDAFAALQATIGDAPDVVLMDQAMNAADRDHLLASCDILLSLHRAEGFGLLLAEAMAAGKPVVATGWSGNMDFMDEQSAVLTPYALTPVRDVQGVYQKGFWAEADVEVAGRALADLIDHRDRRDALGANARALVRRRLAPPVVAEMMRRALEGNTSLPTDDLKGPAHEDRAALHSGRSADHTPATR